MVVSFGDVFTRDASRDVAVPRARSSPSEASTSPSFDEPTPRSRGVPPLDDANLARAFALLDATHATYEASKLDALRRPTLARLGRLCVALATACCGTGTDSGRRSGSGSRRPRRGRTSIDTRATAAASSPPTSRTRLRTRHTPSTNYTPSPPPRWRARRVRDDGANSPNSNSRTPPRISSRRSRIFSPGRISRRRTRAFHRSSAPHPRDTIVRDVLSVARAWVRRARGRRTSCRSRRRGGVVVVGGGGRGLARGAGRGGGVDRGDDHRRVRARRTRTRPRGCRRSHPRRAPTVSSRSSEGWPAAACALVGRDDLAAAAADAAGDARAGAEDLRMRAVPGGYLGDGADDGEGGGGERWRG